MKTILIYSGGMDSTVLLYWLLKQGRDVKALSVDYGQRHGKELESARGIAADLGVQHVVLDLSGMRQIMKGSSQTDLGVEVPEGHYEEQSMKTTVVPNRNMVMLAAAGSYAISEKAQTVAYAAHAGDHAIYPDCRERFVAALDLALGLADWHDVSIERPFVAKTKADIARLGADLGVPFARTWSCYKGGERHCGKCGTCQERLWAFKAAGIQDPTDYESKVLVEPAGAGRSSWRNQ